MAALPVSAKATLLKQGKCQVRYKKGQRGAAKIVFLLQHELKFFPEKALDYKRPEVSLPLPLITSVKRVKQAGQEDAIMLLTLLSEHKQVIFVPEPKNVGDMEQELKSWGRMLTKLSPSFSGFCSLTDGSERVPLAGGETVIK